jgi:hypothetical protein
MGKSSKFINNSVIYVKKLIIMLIQFKFGHFLANFADFDRLCKLEKRGYEIKKKSSQKLLSQSQPNLLKWSLGGPDAIIKGDHLRIISVRFGWDWLSSFRGEYLFLISSVVPFQNCVRQLRPVSKMAAITKNRNFFKWPKLLYFKPESAQIWTV